MIKSKKSSIREAPNQVGEMAAMEIGKKRSASIYARSEEVAALKVPGTVFNDVWSKTPSFQRNLQIEMSTRHRERISAEVVIKENNSLAWFLTSLAAGVIVGLTTFAFFAPATWTVAAKSVLAAGLGVLTLLVTLLHNPAFFWRRCFGLTLLSMLGKFALTHFVSFETSQGFGTLQFALNPSTNSTDWTASLANTLPFVVTLAICAYMDKQNGKK